MMQRDFYHEIKQYQMIQADESVIAGISGGADSVCLLSLLARLRESLSFRLIAVHVNHGIRGEEAERDELFVKELCEKLSVPFVVKRCQVPEYARLHGLSEEEAARILRYHLLSEAAYEAGAVKIAVAHNENDQAETVLFHLIRGSSVKGLSGMKPVAELPGEKGFKLIRPLLFTPRARIEAYLEEQGLAYCTDSTNLEETYARNKIRRTILPAACEINSGAAAHMAQTAALMGELSDYLDRQAAAFEKEHVRATEASVVVEGDSLMELPAVIRSLVLRRAIESLRGGLKDITKLHTEQAEALLAKQVGRQLDLPGGLLVKRVYEGLCFMKKAEKAPSFSSEEGIPLSGEPVEAFGYVFRTACFPAEKVQKIPYSAYTKWFDYDKIKDGLCIRTRKSGDWFQAYKDGRKKSLKTWMVDQKIPHSERDNLPLLAMDDQILWIVGKRGSEAYPVTEETKIIFAVTAEEIEGGYNDERKDQGLNS